MSWWDSDKLKDKMPFLIARQNVKNAIRKWFEAEGFIEVETSQLQTSPGNETHLLGLSTEIELMDGSKIPMFLATSPEFACKKLIAGGMERIFEFAKVFRNRDISNTHSPEFTMLEWYRANEDYKQIISDTLEICRSAAFANNAHFYSFNNLKIPINATPIFITLEEAFIKYAGFSMLEIINDRDVFAYAANNIGVGINRDDDWSDIFTKVLVAKIEPELGKTAPTILYEYPLSEGALAQKTKHDARLVERFELYICGLEIANGFGELIDANEQRQRFIESMNKQKAIYGYSYPIDEELLSAIAKMPPTSGVALGLERLIMLVSGARTINDVLWTPVI